MPDNWLDEVELAESRYSELSKRLRKHLEALAVKTKRRDQVARRVLTSEQVASVRDGSSGDGVYKAMTRMLRAEEDKRAADWMWKIVATMQREGVVSADAQRRNRGRNVTTSTQIGWRGAVGVQGRTWEGMKWKALEIVLRIQGNIDMQQVPRLKKADRQRYWQLIRKRLVEGGTAALADALLWVLAVEHGVEVEGMLEDMGNAVLLAQFDSVCGQVGNLEGAVEQLVQVRNRVQSWIMAMRPTEEKRKYIVAWFAGWAEVMRTVAAEFALEVIAVDIRMLGEAHKLNVQQDLLKLAPQLWCVDVSARVGIRMQELIGHWIALDCTASSRSDSSNRIRKGKKVFYNYRDCKDPYRRPQHSLGTDKGDKCRETDRLAEAALQAVEQSGLSWIFEQPDGQLQWTRVMRAQCQYKEKLDYCRLWSSVERNRGFKWCKMTVIWVKRSDGRRMQLGEEMKCRNQCKCRELTVKGWRHVGQIEAMTEVMELTGLDREQLKCRYPEQLVRMMLDWILRVQ